MTEDLSNTGVHITEALPVTGQTIEEVVSLIGQAAENPLWDPNEHRGASIEGRLGNAIQILVQSYLMGIRELRGLPRGAVNVGSGVVLNFGTLELNRTSSSDRTVGARDWPMGPHDWLRNYQGIVDQVRRLG
ncbi:MAG: hypothetical protein AAB414_00040 [Patescibacteria group bacterium]